MLERILLPTDGTEFAAEITDWTCELARIHDAAVHGLYVNNVSDVVPAASSPAPPEHISEEVEREGREALDRLEARCADGLDLQTEIREGNPAKQILEYSRANDVDLVVMGRKGTSLLSNLGSNTHDVVRNSDVPVTVIPASGSDEE